MDRFGGTSCRPGFEIVNVGAKLSLGIRHQLSFGRDSKALGFQMYQDVHRARAGAKKDLRRGPRGSERTNMIEVQDLLNQEVVLAAGLGQQPALDEIPFGERSRDRGAIDRDGGPEQVYAFT